MALGTQEAGRAYRRTRKQWAEIINANWRKSIASIVETGRHLVGAKEELTPSDFNEMIRADLSFSPTMAKNLMRVANHPVIGKSQDPDFLPTSWSVLSELTTLSKDDFTWAKRWHLIVEVAE